MVLVLDGNDNLDITSVEQLGKLACGLAARNVPIGLAHVHGPVLEMAERSGLLATVGADHVFPTTPAAVAWAQSVADAPAPGWAVRPVRASAGSDEVCPRGSAPHAPGVPQYSRFPRRDAPAARINHDDVTLSWSGPRRCHIVVVARDSAL